MAWITEMQDHVSKIKLVFWEGNHISDQQILIKDLKFLVLILIKDHMQIKQRKETETQNFSLYSPYRFQINLKTPSNNSKLLLGAW